MVNLYWKIFLVVAQPYFYVYTNFGLFARSPTICMNYATFTNKTPQILTIRFGLLRNPRFFSHKKKQIRLNDILTK